ncbi:Alpha-2-Macroglobulin, variant 2 [Balamuthia mandrillaris]
MKKLAALNQQTSPRGGSNKQGSQARIAPTTALSLRPMTLERDVSGPFLSNKEGVAVLPHNTTKAATLFVEKGKDCAFITGVSTFTSLSADTMLLWHVFDDRSMYRPKEEVHIKGYVRFLKRLSNEHFERLELPSLQNVNYRMVDPRSVEVAKGSSCLSGFGSFDFVLNLPDSINLGDVSLHLSLEDHEQTPTYAHVHTFQVQEFRRPEFVAEASVESKNPHFLDPSSKAILKGKASYYAGGGLPDSDATWRVASTDATFAPPGLMDYVFSSQTKLLIKEEDIKQVTSSSSVSVTSFSLVGNDAGSSSDGALQLVVPKKRVSLVPTPFVHSSAQRSSSDCKRTVKGKTRPSGEHKIEILLKSGIPNPPRPLSLAAVLEVMDLNHQTLNATTQLLLHPCVYYVGLQAQESTILMDRPCRIRIVVSNIDGKLVAGVPVYLTLTRWVRKPYYRQSSSSPSPPPPPIHQAMVYRTPHLPSSSSSMMDIIPSQVPSAWEDITVDNKTPNYQKHVVISGSKPIEYELNFSSSNSNDSLVLSCDIHALVEDGEGRKNAAELSLPVQSSAPSLPPSPTSLYPSVPPPAQQQQDKEFEVIAEETLVITSDKTSYRIGETAELLIQCPFAPADALVTARCRGIVKTFLYKLKSTSEVVRVPILEEYAPSINIQVDTVGLAKRSNLDNKEEENAPPRPALATATIELIVPPTTRELTVTVTPQHTKVIPGGETVVAVRVTDHKGQAIKRAAEVAIVVVDEAVLALSNHSLSNPLQTFYPTRPIETKRQRYANRTHISVEKWDNKQLDPPTLHLEQLTADWSDDEEVALSDDEIDVAQLIEAIKDEEETWPEPQLESEPVDNVKVQYSSDEEIADQEEEEEDQEYFNEYGADEEQECLEKLAECAFDDGICLEEKKCAEGSRQRRASSPRSSGRGGGGPHLQRMLHSSGIPPPPRSSSLAYDMAGGCPPPPPAGAPCASNASLMMPSYSASPSSSFAKRECEKMDSFAPMAQMECASFAKSAAPRKAMKKGGFGISLPAPSLPSFSRSSAAPVRQRKEMKKKSIAKDKSFSRAKKMERNARAESDDDCEEADEEEEYEGEMLADAEEEVCPIIAVRSNFNPLANFTASVLVDDEGKAQIDVKIPDSLTRYRIWAVAVSRDGKSYGLGENLIIAQLPLVVRCTPPRFLNFGDSFELSIIIQNQLEQTLDIDIGIRVSHHVEIITSEEEDGTETGIRETGFKGHVIGEGRRLVTVPMRTKSVGMACFQVSCSSGKYGDAANVQIPIYPPATAESFAQYGSLPGDVEVIQKQITKPAGALPQFGALELSASSTMMQGLLDAVYYLYSYPNECCEQISSKLLGLVALHDVLDSFPSDKLPKRKELKSLVSADLKRLKKRQSKNGGFGMWTAHSTVDPFVSCHVAHCLGLCKAKGFGLPFFIESRIVSYLKDVLFSDIRTYSSDARALITSYALYARYRLSPDASIKQEAEQYYASHAPDELPMEALGLLLSIFADTSTTGTLMFKKQQKRSACADEVVRYLANHIKVDKDTGLAHAPSYYDELSRHSLLHSNYRVDAMLLEGLVMADPEHELVAPLAKGLLAMRRNGTWLNTQENAWATIALNRYFTVCEKDKPDFAARFWLAEQYCGEALFKGRNADTKFIRVPMLEFSKCAQKANSVRAAGDLTFGQVDLHRSAALSKEGSKVGLALAIDLAEAKKTKKGRKEEEEKEEGKKKGSLLQVPGSEQSSSSPRKESKSPRKDSSKSPRKDSTKSPRKDSSSSSSSSSSGKSPRKEEKTSKKDKGKSPRKGTKIEESKSSSPRDSAKNKKKGEEKYPAEVADLLLQKEGKGRLYYRLGMSYAPADLVIPAKSFGFTVQRRFSAVITDDEKDAEKKKQQEEKVKQDKDGVWHVVKGSLVRVTLTVTANFPRYNIALVDKLAAGLEAENPAINKVTKDKSVKEEEEKGKDKEEEKDKTTVWWQHQNLRDERVECYASELAKGVEYKYEYIARATSEGRFVVPPCRCEEMYNPDLYGHTASTILVVESEKKEE